MSIRWERREFNLPENRSSTAKPGNRIFVPNQGTVRFEVPNTWILNTPARSKSFRSFDAGPPSPQGIARLGSSMGNAPRQQLDNGR